MKAIKQYGKPMRVIKRSS